MIRPRGNDVTQQSLRQLIDRTAALDASSRIEVLPALEYIAPSVPAVDAAPFPLYIQARNGPAVRGVIILQAPAAAVAQSVSWEVVENARIRIRCIVGIPSGLQRVTLGVVYAS